MKCLCLKFKLGTEEALILQIQPNHPLDEMSIACILRDLLHAIEYLHNEGKIHRDIKGFHIYPLTRELYHSSILFLNAHHLVACVIWIRLMLVFRFRQGIFFFILFELFFRVGAS